MPNILLASNAVGCGGPRLYSNTLTENRSQSDSDTDHMNSSLRRETYWLLRQYGVVFKVARGHLAKKNSYQFSSALLSIYAVECQAIVTFGHCQRDGRSTHFGMRKLP